MSSENLQQNFANATGLLLDRTFDPPKVLGEAFIVSKSRAVTCASSLFNYAEAPWALAINFPHPDLLLGAKAVALHPDFDKKEARTNYLANSGIGAEKTSAQLNDFATIVLDPILQELQADKIAELRRALALPFSNVGVEASGAVHGTTELLNLIKAITDSSKSGLLTLFDVFNIPVAAIQFVEGSIQKATYNGIVAEMAFSEILYRNPGTGYAFSAQANFQWGNSRDVVVPTPNLVQEALRRVQELPSALNYIGGLHSRYQRSAQELTLADTNENMKWLIQAIWSSLDGFIAVDKLSERVGADTFTIVQGLREMLNQGMVSLLRKATPFSCLGQLGAPLTSHMDFDINPGDPLMAFYLDPLSGAPVWQKGEFAGVSSVLQPKNLLHTIPVPANAKGALILKNYKLVGVHNGSVLSKAGQAPGKPVSQMMFMSAMLDMSARKLRGTTDSEDQATNSRIATLRTATESVAGVASEGADKYICSNCYSANSKLGPCSNCGAIIEPPPGEWEPPEKLAKILPIKKLRSLQRQYGVTNEQLIIGSACAVVLPLFTLMMCFHNTSLPVVPVIHTGHESAPQAVKVAERVGFKVTCPPGYWYADTLELTKPSDSFALNSETANQNVLFVVFNDMSAVQGFENFLSKPPFANTSESIGLNDFKVDSGSQTLGYGALTWYCSRYPVAPTETSPIDKQMLLIGAFGSKEQGKSVLVIGRPLKAEQNYDYKSALWLIDQMAEDFTQEENGKRTAEGVQNTGVKTSANKKPNETGPVVFATENQIKNFLTSAQKQVQAKLVLPDGMKKELDDPKSKKLHVNLAIAVDGDGKITKLDIADPSEAEKVTDAVVKAVKTAAPFKDAPKIESGSLALIVKLRKDKIKVVRDE